MSFLAELVLETVLGVFFFVTGELLLTALTLGKRRVRWWEVQDANVSFGPVLLGFAFWAGVIALLFRVL